jgi:hypothetical protein
MPRPERRLERPRLRLSVREQWRVSTDTGVNVACDLGAAPRDKATQWLPQKARQADDGRVTEQVDEKGPNRRQRIRPTEIHQDDSHSGHITRWQENWLAVCEFGETML